MKKILIAITVISILSLLIYANSTYKKQVDVGEAIAKKVINTSLEISEIDATALAGISEKLEKSCAKNKYGLSENDCVVAIRNRKDICTQQTAQNFPGQIANTDRMQIVVTYYIDCLFQQNQ